MGAPCIFPFIFNGISYQGCTLAEASDNEAWCSVKVDANGNHVGGEGKWGTCPTNGGCPNDLSMCDLFSANSH